MGGARVAGEPERVYDVVYEARLLPSQRAARVTMRVAQDGPLLREVRLSIDPARHLDFEGDGVVESGERSLRWEVPAGGGALSYTVVIDHLREPAEYDARCTRRWALFRGSDLFPPSASRVARGSRSRAELLFRLPPRWKAETRFERTGVTRFRIGAGERSLARPTGWMIVGRIDVTVAQVDGLELRVAAPSSHDFRARDLVALLRWTLPELGALVELPERLLFVGADDPMWRGGLSGPGSVYLHQDRPLVEADGTSPLLHELIHVLTSAVAGEQGSWIVEGLAEYYSLQVLRRSRTISEDEYDAALAGLAERGRDAGTLLDGRADRDTTARAVDVLHRLDGRIRRASQQARSLDDVLRAQDGGSEPVSYASFRERAERAAGRPLDDFFAKYVD